MAFCKPIENLQAYVVDVCIYTTFILEFCITNLTRKGYFCDLNYQSKTAELSPFIDSYLLSEIFRY